MCFPKKVNALQYSNELLVRDFWFLLPNCNCNVDVSGDLYEKKRTNGCLSNRFGNSWMHLLWILQKTVAFYDFDRFRFDSWIIDNQRIEYVFRRFKSPNYLLWRGSNYYKLHVHLHMFWICTIYQIPCYFFPLHDWSIILEAYKK
jgi:hypothetical protein